MGSWDEQHRLRPRAERAQILLRALWGDEPPPGHNAELITLIDAIAGDDAHGRQDHLICQVDGLTYEALAHLLLLSQAARTSKASDLAPLDQEPMEPGRPPARSALPRQERTVHGGDAVAAAVSPTLLARLVALGLLDAPRSGPGERAPHPVGTSGGPPRAGVRGEDATAAPRSPVPIPELEGGSDTAAVTGVWELDPATGIVAFDDVAARLIGAGTTAGSDLLDRHLQDLVHPDDRPSVAQGMQECLRTGLPFLNRFRACPPSGQVVWLISQGRVIHNPTDASPRLTGFVTLDRQSSPARGVGVLHT